jgi:hypothetical protein
MRWLKKCPGRDFACFAAKSFKHQFPGCAKHATNVGDLKTLALHLQMSNDGNRSKPELGATIGDNLQGDLIAVSSGVHHVTAKTR